MMQRIIDRLTTKLRQFRSTSSGNVAVTFAIMIVPVMGGVGAAIDYSQSSSIKTAMQAAADAAALGTVKIASTLTPEQVQSTASGLFNASFSRPNVTPGVAASYDSGSSTVTVTASASYKPNIVNMMGIMQIAMSANSKATVGGKTWQICVMVTEPTNNHTLMVEGGSKIDFTNCMVQVNTANWDAVEARDTSYIHSTNGENCFVGDIHYGDVQPPKNPTCTMFADPFAAYTVPTNTCTYTNKVVTAAGTTLTPGTYCGGININADVTFSPGVYYIQDGDFKVLGTANVTANEVTFLISGSNSNIHISTSGTLTMSPNTNAGQFSGFLFYYDQPAAINNKKSSTAGKNKIQKAKLNGSGIIYLVNQTLEFDNGAVITINPGSIIAHEILPDGGSTLNLTGTLNSSLAVLNSMKKTSTNSGSPRLIN